jgi:hypothetical protein
MPLINVKDLTPGNIVYEFLFSGDEPVGYVMFFIADHKLRYSISLNTATTYGYYFDFLADHPNESFIVLTDGYSSYFLSEDNRLYNASTGSIVDDISITGDCYHAFSYDKIGVSYEEIVNQDILQTQPDNSTGPGTLPGADEIYPTIMVEGNLYEWRKGAAISSELPDDCVYYGELIHVEGETPNNNNEFVSVFSVSGQIYTVSQTDTVVYLCLTTDWLENTVVVFDLVERE